MLGDDVGAGRGDDGAAARALAAPRPPSGERQAPASVPAGVSERQGGRSTSRAAGGPRLPLTTSTLWLITYPRGSQQNVSRNTSAIWLLYLALTSPTNPEGVKWGAGKGGRGVKCWEV